MEVVGCEGVQQLQAGSRGCAAARSAWHATYLTIPDANTAVYHQWHRGYNLLLYWQKHKLIWACWSCILLKVRFPDPQLVGEHSPVMTDEVPVVGFVNLHRQHCNEHWTTLESCAADAFAFCKLKIIMLHIMHIGYQTKHHNHIYNQTNQKRRSRLKKIASGQKCLTASSQNRALPLISECWFCRAEPFCRLVKMLRAWVAPRIAGVIDCGGLLYWGHTIAKELPRHRISTAISRGSLACTLSSTEATQTRQGNFRIQPNLRDSGRPIPFLRVWKYTVSQKIH